MRILDKYNLRSGICRMIWPYITIWRFKKNLYCYPNSLRTTVLREPECFVSVGIHTQGESVALNSEGTSYFSHSESVNQPILKFDIYQWK